jgi:alkylhydroperoxidase/carboxymuconolactone decarboxylase family protein YurZ
MWNGYAPEKFALYQEWMAGMLNHDELQPKVREFVIFALDSMVAWPEPFIDAHLNLAFDNGATIQELIEVSQTTGYIMGVHSLNHGLTSLERVIANRKAAGLPTPRDASENTHEVS